MDLPIRVTCLVCDELFEMLLEDITIRGKSSICPSCEAKEACSYCGVTITDENAIRHKDGVCQTGGSD